jgi:hypothetical protein
MEPLIEDSLSRYARFFSQRPRWLASCKTLGRLEAEAGKQGEELRNQ